MTSHTDEARLEFIVSSKDVDAEIRLLAQDAARMLERTKEVPARSRLRRERRDFGH